MDFNDELILTFREEALDLIERVRDKLDNFIESNDKVERFQDILRVIHTVKGNSASVGYHELRTAAHELESILLNYKTKEEKITRDTLALIYNYFDYLENFIESNSKEKIQIPVIKEQTKNSEYCIFESEEPQKQNLEKEQIDTLTISPSKPTGLKNENEKNFVKAANTDFIRIPTEKIQKNFDILSEIFLSRNQMRYLVDQFNLSNISQEDFFVKWELFDNSLRKSIGELEQIVMSMRLTPITSLLRRMEKTVRGYLEDHKTKDIRVEIIGEDVEVDKKILDSLAEPLIHLTRNAMDHGIETKEERKRLHKPEQAVIKFVAKILGNEVHLTVSDDGCGIDENKVYNIALKKGLNVAHLTTKEEKINIIFMPGFSTVEKANDTSGRGIGMEAVKVYVESINGSLTTKTEINKGTEFCLKLPLGMSVIPVIIAKANNQEFAILNSDIRELKSIYIDEIVQNGDSSYYKSEGGFIKCININNYIFTSSSKKLKYVSKKQKIPLCIIDYNGKPIAVRIDELISNAEIVIKEYPSISPKLSYISGVSILSTGKPTFVISLSKLCEKINNELFKI